MVRGWRVLGFGGGWRGAGLGAWGWQGWRGLQTPTMGRFWRFRPLSGGFAPVLGGFWGFWWRFGGFEGVENG